MPEYITKSELSRRLNCKPPYVTALCRKGNRVVMAPDGQRIDYEATMALLEATKRPTRIRKRESGDTAPVEAAVEALVRDHRTDRSGESMEQKRTRLTMEQLESHAGWEEERRKIAELERKELEGELVRAAGVERSQEAMATAVKDAVMGFPSRVAGRISAELRVKHEILLSILDRECHRLLEEMSIAAGGEQTA